MVKQQEQVEFKEDTSARGWIIAATITNWFFVAIIPGILALIGLSKCNKESEHGKTLRTFAWLNLGYAIAKFALFIFYFAIIMSVVA